MKASARAARRFIRERTRAQRAASRIARRGTGSLVTYCLAAGLPPREARSVASTLRRTARRLGIEGTEARVHAGRRMRTTSRFTPEQVAAIAAAYRPRKAAFKAVKARLALAA